MDEVSHPLLKRLREDWKSWRGERPMPARQDFEPADIIYILGNVSLVEIEKEPLRFRYRIHGTNLAARFGYELTGKHLDCHPDSNYRGMLQDHFTAVMARREPIGMIRFRQLGEYHAERCESLVLPLSADGATVNMLLSAVVFR